MNRTHRHRTAPSLARTYAYSSGCGAPSITNPDQRSTGGVVRVEACRCGAWRAALANGRFETKGSWVSP